MMADKLNKNEEPDYSDDSELEHVTLSVEEFNEVIHRVHHILGNRVERAWRKRCTAKTDRNVKSHVEASKDAFAFMHVLSLIDSMTEEIHMLRVHIEQLSDEDESPRFPPKSTKDGGYIN